MLYTARMPQAERRMRVDFRTATASLGEHADDLSRERSPGFLWRAGGAEGATAPGNSQATRTAEGSTLESRMPDGRD